MENDNMLFIEERRNKPFNKDLDHIRQFYYGIEISLLLLGMGYILFLL